MCWLRKYQVVWWLEVINKIFLNHFWRLIRWQTSVIFMRTSVILSRKVTWAVFHKDCNHFNVYFLFQFQNLTEIISAVIISKYCCIKPHEINLSCNNYNRLNLKLEHKFVVCTHAQYLFCLKNNNYNWTTFRVKNRLRPVTNT